MVDKFDNGTLFFRLRLPSTLIRTNADKFSLENVLQSGRIQKLRLAELVWTENILKTELFETCDSRGRAQCLDMRMLKGAFKRFCRLWSL